MKPEMSDAKAWKIVGAIVSCVAFTGATLGIAMDLPTLFLVGLAGTVVGIGLFIVGRFME